MTLENIKAECERDTARVDALHEKMDKLSKADTQDKTTTTQDAPGQPMPYVPQQRGPRPAILITALVAVLAIVLIAVLVYIVVSQDESPTGAYEEYVDALNDKDAKRMFDQTVARFAEDYEQNIQQMGDAAFYLNPEIEILDFGVTYRDDLTTAQDLMAGIAVAEIEYLLSVEVDDYCIVNYTIVLTYTETGDSDTLDGEILCVKIDGRWYLASPTFY